LAINPASVTTVGHPRMDTDLLGAAVPQNSSARPGPWQNLGGGTTSLALWRGIDSLPAGSLPLTVPPTITPIGPQLIGRSSSTGALAFTIADQDSPISSLIVTAASSNGVLVLPSGLQFGGSGMQRTLVVTPVPSATGSATITVTVSDGNHSTATSFSLVVAAFAERIPISFQPAMAPASSGWLVDGGLVTGLRSSGLVYGWNRDMTDAARDRNLVNDQRLDTLIILGDAATAGPVWTIDLGNGQYAVTVTCGDPSYNAGRQVVSVQGVVAVDASTPSVASVSGTITVMVTDGHLRVRIANGGVNVKLLSIEINLVGGGTG